MNKTININTDRVIYNVSIMLIIVPAIIFLLSFIKYYISIPIVLLIGYLSFKIIKNYKKTNYKPNKKYWITACIIIFLWLFLSGVGDFTYQNVVDFHVRHAILRDLINYPWPVIYKNSYLVYYLSFFIPPALVGKITSFRFANFFLFFYSYCFIVNALYLTNRHLKKDYYSTLIMFVLFSGMDIIGIPDLILTTKPLEWWNGLFQYSSNTTSLYWVFNQALPIWLISSLLLNIDDKQDIVFISSSSFFYSPYATICLIPVVLALFLRNNKKILKDIISPSVLFAILIAIIVGIYYMSSGGLAYSGFIFNIVENKMVIIISYILFIILEIGLFVIPTWKYFHNDLFYKVIVIELLLIPLYVISENNDFCMRGSTPLLFFLMVYFCSYLSNNKYKKNILLYLLLSISFVTPSHEILRSVYKTFTSKNYIADNIVSIGKPRKYKTLVEKQFYGDLNSLYCKYIQK